MCCVVHLWSTWADSNIAENFTGKKVESVSLSDSSPNEIWAPLSDWPVSRVTWPAGSNLWKSLHMGQMKGSHINYQFTASQGWFQGTLFLCLFVSYPIKNIENNTNKLHAHAIEWKSNICGQQVEEFGICDYICFNSRFHINKYTVHQNYRHVYLFFIITIFHILT